MRLVPFSEMIDYLTGTPRIDSGISTSRIRPPSFLEELASLEEPIDFLAEAIALTKPHRKNSRPVTEAQNPLNPHGEVVPIDSMREAMGQNDVLSSQIRPPHAVAGPNDDGVAAAAQGAAA